MSESVWRRSSRCAANGTCVEVAAFPEDTQWRRSRYCAASNGCVEASAARHHIQVRGQHRPGRSGPPPRCRRMARVPHRPQGAGPMTDAPAALCRDARRPRPIPAGRLPLLPDGETP